MCKVCTGTHVIGITRPHTRYSDIKKHGTGEISRVSLSTVTLGRRMIRVANLPPEIPAEVIQRIMHKFGSVQEITVEKRSKA